MRMRMAMRVRIRKRSWRGGGARSVEVETDKNVVDGEAGVGEHEGGKKSKCNSQSEDGDEKVACSGGGEREGGEKQQHGHKKINMRNEGKLHAILEIPRDVDEHALVHCRGSHASFGLMRKDRCVATHSSWAS
eukprot:TRINITY_DN17953_c1_g2_i1.p1 TRINITY_DN17953_c1_g2~~TRINITY_DN17953_c1_g2_i1.p1  ORF type:complete len:133 (+),score=17.95 TRINITY_DN17953_c1_g2_i1:105-503(+)